MSIQLTNVHKSYQRKNVLEDFSLTIQEGDFWVIHGESGVGKSTLLNIIGLLESIDNGTYTLNKQTVPKFSSH